MTVLKKKLIALWTATFCVLAACSTTSETEVTAGAAGELVNYGVLVMAHGGGEKWNAAVIAAVQELESRYPTEIAFGMADAHSMEEAVRKLEQQGVEHVGVVRLFVSGESWYERTEQILGMTAGAPDKQVAMANEGDGHMGGMRMGFWQIDTDIQFHLSEEGLADAQEMDAVLTSRISALSRDPRNEVVVVLAHGPGDDAENTRWIEKISARTDSARNSIGVADVRVFTLREDWQAKREEAETEIRAYMRAAQETGKQVLVIPYRVMGFGPYHEVLEGLNYRADETGLLPHENVDLWMLNQARELGQIAQEHHVELIAAMQ